MHLFNRSAKARSYTWLSALLLAVALAPVAGCTEDHCTADTHCLSGERCNVATNTCYVDTADAGDATPDGGDATPDGDAGPNTCTTSVDCHTAALPICDGNGDCVPCGNPSECQAKDSSRPLCQGGRCQQCTDSSDHCPTAAPICDTEGTCVQCTNGSNECATPYPNEPICLAGECVQCTDSVTDCGSQTPFCDPTTNTCRECEEHAECDFGSPNTGICKAGDGQCIDPAAIIYVDGQAGCNDSGNCDSASPACCTITGALGKVDGTRSTILVASGVYAPISVNLSDPVYLVTRVGAEIASLTAGTMVFVNGTNTILTMDGFVIRSASGAGNYGVQCIGSATLTLSNNDIIQNPSGGFSATDCNVTLIRNDINSNTGGGVSLTNCNFSVVNNMITENGNSGSPFGGVLISTPGTLRNFHSNTVADNNANAIEGGISCFPTADVVSTISYNNTGGDIAAACVVTSSWTTADGNPLFVGGGDYHLTSASLCINAGDTVDPPAVDFDNETRDASPDIGADEYVP